MYINVLDAAHQITKRGMSDTSTVAARVSLAVRSWSCEILPDCCITATHRDLYFDNIYRQRNGTILDTPSSKLFVGGRGANADILLAPA